MPPKRLSLPPHFFVPPDEFPKTQEALKDPENWNSRWETMYQTHRYKDVLFDPKVNLMQFFEVEQTIQRITGTTSITSQDIQNYIIIHDSTCEVQHRIGMNFVIVTSREDFEKRWLESDVAVRRKHVLRALSNAGSLAYNLNHARAYTFDILRLDHLSQNGRVLLDLLKSLIPDNLELLVPPKTPYYFPDPKWDSLRAEFENSSDESKKYAFKEMLIVRTKLICVSSFEIMFFRTLKRFNFI
jgi:hypothetical protein